MTSRIGVVADDLTGANDTAVQFAGVGWPTLVALSRPLTLGAAETSGVLAVTTDSRASTPALARLRTAEAVREMAALGTGHLYLKLDSTMRGSAAAQISGAVEAWSEQHPDAFVLLCPAYPAMGRTVVGGEVRMNSEPLEKGAPGWDPVTPVTTSVLSELVPGAVHVENAGLVVDELVREIRSAAKHASVVTVDAVTNDHLGLLAEVVAMLGAAAVPAGSAGLASTLALRWRDDQDVPRGTAEATRPPWRGPVLVLVTSLNAAARTQQERLVQEFGEQVQGFEPSLQDLLDGERLGGWRHERTRPSLAGHDVVVVSAPEEKSSGTLEATDLIAERLADLVADLHATHGFSAVVVTGGDGARALVNRWGCAGIAVHSAVSEGMPQGVLVGGEVDGLPIVTKAGGFGDRDALVLAVRSCQTDDKASAPGDRLQH